MSGVRSMSSHFTSGSYLRTCDVSKKIDMLIELHPIDEIFDILDIDLADVIAILVRGGHVKLPDYCENVYG